MKVADLTASRVEGIPAEVARIAMQDEGESFPMVLVEGQPALSGRLPTAEEISRFVREGRREQNSIIRQADSAVEFATEKRIHISLDVKNVADSLPFYRILLGQNPTKVRPDPDNPDYAKFEVVEPPLNLALNLDPSGENHGAHGHYGIQVKNSATVEESKVRLKKAGFKVTEETETACCYAVQTKIWVADPDGNRWEIFVVTEAEADEGCGPDCICWQDMERSFVQLFRPQT